MLVKWKSIIVQNKRVLQSLIGVWGSRLEIYNSFGHIQIAIQDDASYEEHALQHQL